MGQKYKSDRFYFPVLQNHRRQGLQLQNYKTPAPWKECYNKPWQSVNKQRQHSSIKYPSIQSLIFPVAMYGCESWTIKNAQHQRTSAFKLWCWRRLLRVPWIARRSDQPILKKINPKYSLQRLMLKLNTFQYFTIFYSIQCQFLLRLVLLFYNVNVI